MTLAIIIMAALAVFIQFVNGTISLPSRKPKALPDPHEYTHKTKMLEIECLGMDWWKDLGTECKCDWCKVIPKPPKGGGSHVFTPSERRNIDAQAKAIAQRAEAAYDRMSGKPTHPKYARDVEGRRFWLPNWVPEDAVGKWDERQGHASFTWYRADKVGGTNKRVIKVMPELAIPEASEIRVDELLEPIMLRPSVYCNNGHALPKTNGRCEQCDKNKRRRRAMRMGYM